MHIKANHTLIYGDFEDINPEHQQIFCYRRWDTDGEFLIVHNFSNHVIDWENPYKTLTFQIGNYNKLNKSKLAPWESRIYCKIKEYER